MPPVTPVPLELSARAAGCAGPVRAHRWMRSASPWGCVHTAGCNRATSALDARRPTHLTTTHTPTHKHKHPPHTHTHTHTHTPTGRYDLRAEHPVIGAWFAAMEQRETYRGTMSDFHTHAHDLPPQMGGCYSNDTAGARACSEAVDCGPWSAVPDVDTASYPDPADSKLEAAFRVLKHRETVKGINPLGSEAADEAMRAALTRMLTGEDVACDRGVTGADAACQYVPQPTPLQPVRPARAHAHAHAHEVGKFLCVRPCATVVGGGKAHRCCHANLPVPAHVFLSGTSATGSLCRVT